MPNRIIKESIWDSPSLNKLSDLAERHFYKLIPLPDDFGCWQSTPSVVKGRLYPRRTYVTEEQIEAWQNELDQGDICKFWVQDGRQYGIFVNWSKHQRIRSIHQRKTPPPPPEIIQLIERLQDNKNSLSIDVNCRQVSSNDRLNPNPNPNPNPEIKDTVKPISLTNNCGKDVDNSNKEKISQLTKSIFKSMDPVENNWEKKETQKLQKALKLLTKQNLNFGFLRNIIKGEYHPDKRPLSSDEAWAIIRYIKESSWQKCKNQNEFCALLRDCLQYPNKYIIA